MRILPFLFLLFAFPALGDDVVLRRAFPQQYTKAQAKKIVTLRFTSEERDPRLKQTLLIYAYSETVNSGKFNVHEVISYYRDGYLNRVEIVVLPFQGEGNRLRLAIHVGTEGNSSSERNFQHHAVMAKYMIKHHYDQVPIQTVVDHTGRPYIPALGAGQPLCEEILYLEPAWYDPTVTIESLTKKSEARSAVSVAAH